MGYLLMMIGMLTVVIAAVFSQKNKQKDEPQSNHSNDNDNQVTTVVQPSISTTYRFCPNCGAKIMEGARFCISCGNSIVPIPEDTPVTEQKVERSESEWKEYFKTIIYDSFSNFTIQEDVPVTQLTGDINDVFKLYKDRPNQVYKAEWGRPYDFVLFEGDKVKAVIMLGNGHSHSINVKYLISKMFAKKLKVPYISFYTQFPNKEDYIINRIKDNLIN